MTTLQELKDICDRSRTTLLQDAAGAAAIGIMLIVVLHLPVLS